MQSSFRTRLHTAAFAATLLGAARPVFAQGAAPPSRPALLVLAKDDRTLAIVDPATGATGAMAARVPAGPDPHEVVASPDGRLAYVSNYEGGTGHTLTVIDLAARRVLRVIDLGAGRVVATLAAGVRGANRLKFTPDGALAFVSTLGGPDVTVLRAATRAVVARIPVGRGAAGILMQPDGARAYVACTPDDDVAVIDVRSLAVVGRVRAGRGPDGLAWAARPISTNGPTPPHPSPRATP